MQTGTSSCLRGVFDEVFDNPGSSPTGGLKASTLPASRTGVVLAS